MTYILHIETATKVCSVALSKDSHLLACKESNDLDYAHGENLTLFIDEVMKEAQIDFKNLNAISVSSGPGSYTGLRIGVSTAKGLCYALNIPLIAIDTLTSLAILAKEKHANKNLCAVLDARRMEVYNAIFAPDGYLLKPISADVIEATSYEMYLPFIVFGDGAEKLKAIWEDRNIAFDTSLFCSARGQINLAHEKFKENKFEDVAYFEPFYLKDFMITSPKKKQDAK